MIKRYGIRKCNFQKSRTNFKTNKIENLYTAHYVQMVNYEMGTTVYKNINWTILNFELGSHLKMKIPSKMTTCSQWLLKILKIYRNQSINWKTKARGKWYSDTQ
jgi:hypothetical protein